MKDGYLGTWKFESKIRALAKVYQDGYFVCVSACDRTVLHSQFAYDGLNSDIDSIQYVIRERSVDNIEDKKDIEFYKAKADKQ